MPSLSLYRVKGASNTTEEENRKTLQNKTLQNMALAKKTFSEAVQNNDREFGFCRSLRTNLTPSQIEVEGFRIADFFYVTRKHLSI